jgi:hypothetical protein
MANATVTVLEADGVTETDVVVLDVGRQAAAASKSVATCTEDKAVLDAIAASLAIIDNFTATTLGAGNTDANTQRVTLASNDVAVAAVVSAINDAASPIVAQDTSTLYAGTTALTPKFAVISESSSGNNEVVAAVVGKKIRVLQWIVSGSAAVNFKWRTASTDISGLFYIASAGGGAAGSYNPVGHFETVANEALNLNLSGAVAVGGSVVYVEV